MRSEKAQVSVFIIIAIVIVAGVLVYFLISEGVIFQAGMPKEVEPVYSYYLDCIGEIAYEGSLIMGSQGGYIDVPEFEPGSEYMPFSSQLSFFGIGIPYWYYISGNGIVKGQMPSKKKMQEQLNDYVEERIGLCDFSGFADSGFEVAFENLEVKTTIRNKEILVEIEQDLEINFGETSFRRDSHSSKIDSYLGEFYNLAQKIYSHQEDSMFLENYGVDILRLNAPVDGSEIGCSPKIWQVDDIRTDLINALNINVPSIKVKGNYYDLAKEENKYFVQDIGVNVGMDVNFLYSQDWPMKLEVWPEEDGLLIADPVGLQEGMGMLGFCYVPYHFVYDFAYPVLIQMYSGDEMFQFPVVVNIDKNQARKAEYVEGLPDVVPELCENKLTEMRVETYDSDLNPVPASIRFKCFDTSCYIGEAEEGVLVSDFPQCVNGFVVASAEGYKTKKYLISSVNGGEAVVVLDRKYKLDLEVQKAGTKLSGDYAVVNFVGDDGSVTVAYPEQEEIELTEGQYEIKVYIYSNASIRLEGSVTEKCVDVPRSGFLGAFGITEEKCFTTEIPDQIVSFAVSGGGTQNYYIAEPELETGKLVINAEGFGIPSAVVQLQENYNNIEIKGLEVLFG
jgi:hypothetical protein